MNTANDYPYIRAWSRMMGSMPYYITGQIARAKATNAPPTAIYEKHESGTGGTGEWEVFEDIQSELTKAHVQDIVDKWYS